MYRHHSRQSGQRIRAVALVGSGSQPVVGMGKHGGEFDGGEDDGSVIVPYADVIERADSFEITADVPGADERHVKVGIDHTTLTIDAVPGNADEFDERAAVHREFWMAHYRRSFTLPRDIDRESVVASVRDGVLRVTLRKAPQSEGCAIPVIPE